MYVGLAMGALLLLLWGAVIWLAYSDEKLYYLAQSPSDRAQKATFLSALIVAVAQAVALPCFASEGRAQDSAGTLHIVTGLAK